MATLQRPPRGSSREGGGLGKIQGQVVQEDPGGCFSRSKPALSARTLHPQLWKASSGLDCMRGQIFVQNGCVCDPANLECSLAWGRGVLCWESLLHSGGREGVRKAYHCRTPTLMCHQCKAEAPPAPHRPRHRRPRLGDKVRTFFLCNCPAHTGCIGFFRECCTSHDVKSYSPIVLPVDGWQFRILPWEGRGVDNPGRIWRRLGEDLSE